MIAPGGGLVDGSGNACSSIALKGCTVSGKRSIEFFEQLVERQVKQPAVGLNPFEQSALPYPHGQVLDYVCGVGRLAIAAARSVLALDASEVAIDDLRSIANTNGLLRQY